MGFSLSFLLVLVVLLQCAQPAAAFGAGNIASISKIEGKNWRHGDIEDTLKLLAFIKGHKWTSMMVKRVYFGNWLRDYSQAVDVGTLKGVPAETIRVLLWILSFLTFGYATQEFEVTAERLGCYRPEEHIDNPRDYADNEDARKYDPRLRGPVQPVELEIDMQTGMKNYIANETLGIATSSGYVKHSLKRSIHFGRMYRHGSGGAKGREEDLCEALRCLGQALHCCEDFGAHSNYCELALREMGHRNVFPHCGQSSEINLRGHRVFPIVTGTFGGVDFLHSVIGEANDHLTQSEVDELDKTLGTAQQASQGSSRGFGDEGGDDSANILIGLLSQIPGTGELGNQARDLQAASQEQERHNATGQGFSGMGGRGGGNYGGGYDQGYGGSRGFESTRGFEGGNEGGFGGSARANEPGFGQGGVQGAAASIQSVDPQEIVKKIYPILAFRDRVVKTLSATIEKIPGLESLVEKISETVTLFVMRLLAPFIRPLIDVVNKQLKTGSSTVVSASGKHQYEPWTDPHCTDPTHSLLSKDHFTNILNECAGKVASEILKYVVPRVLWAWEHPDAELDQILSDVCRVFHHPVLRDMNNDAHRAMFSTVEQYARSTQHNIDQLLSADSVRAGKNHVGSEDPHAGGSAVNAMQSMFNSGGNVQAAESSLGQGNAAWNLVSKLTGSGGGGSSGGHGYGGGSSSGGGIPGLGDLGGLGKLVGGNIPGLGGMKIPGLSREMDFEGEAQNMGREFPGTETGYDTSRPPPGREPQFGGPGYTGGNEGYEQHQPGAFGYQTGPQYEGGYQQGYRQDEPQPWEHHSGGYGGGNGGYGQEGYGGGRGYQQESSGGYAGGYGRY